jgi:hypothetical protein
LREILARRGVQIPAAGIVGIAASQFVHRAPAGFAQTVMQSVQGNPPSPIAIRVMMQLLRRSWMMVLKIAVATVLLASAIAVPVGIALAGGSPPTTAPGAAERGPDAAETTDSQKPDMSTPLGTMHMFNDALAHSDWAELQRILYAVTPQHQQIATVMVNNMKTMSELKQEITAKFGPNAATQSKLLQMGARMDMDLLDADVQTEGDHAEVRFNIPHAQPFEFVKVNNEWRLAIAQLISKNQTDAQEKTYLNVMQKQNDHLSQTLADLKNGTLQTMAEVKHSLNGRK